MYDSKLPCIIALSNLNVIWAHGYSFHLWNYTKNFEQRSISFEVTNVNVESDAVSSSHRAQEFYRKINSLSSIFFTSICMYLDERTPI